MPHTTKVGVLKRAGRKEYIQRRAISWGSLLSVFTQLLPFLQEAFEFRVLLYVADGATLTWSCPYFIALKIQNPGNTNVFVPYVSIDRASHKKEKEKPP